MATAFATTTLNQQVLVLTGATSAIGEATARMAAASGARLVLAARDADALEALAVELRAGGTDVETAPAGAGNPAEVAAIAQAAQARFGRVGSWINIPGVDVFGANDQSVLDDMQRVMQTNFWGVVNGTLEAVKLMRAQGGGTIVNVGSVAREPALALQGTYAAAEQAVQGFTESLRMELGREKAPVELALVTGMLQDQHAVDSVARAILQAAAHPRREIVASRAGALSSVVNAKTLLVGGALLAGWAMARRPARRSWRT